MGGTMLSKSLIQLSVDCWGCVPSMRLDLRPNYGGGNEDYGKRSRVPPAVQQATATHVSARGSWTCMGKSQSLVGSLLPSSESWCTQGSVCALQESVSPVLRKLWHFYGGINGNLLQEGLCHTQVCCTQSPCRCGRPLLTSTSTGDTQTQF